ncbi:methylamine utilization protein [Sphingomonas piscis]|uniref:Methylamine utilization protein n=1 Tax=Sphingomonas piscis TaxID=2714943 RepID=A0A6G7YLC5_9SPHN|nr:methylamine utilization protein [Sphingomonas piscis]QIK77545.1 methylamine utilization protein [Sphingomonas piscis]
MLRPFTLLAALSFVTPAVASPLVAQVLDAAGKPVQNAVVAFRPAGVSVRPRVGAGYAIAQKDMQFRPFVAVVPVGATVSFPNLDPTKHHVYSFSAAKKFELKLFAKDQSRSIRFDKAGVVPLGCNIHDSMSAFLYVSDTAFAATTDSRGIVRFGDAPPAGALTVWHPYLRSPGNQMVRQLRPNERAVKVAVRLRPPPMHSSSGY